MVDRKSLQVLYQFGSRSAKPGHSVASSTVTFTGVTLLERYIAIATLALLVSGPLKVPGSRGMRMRLIPSSAAINPAMVGPMPPNGTSVNSRGS